MSDNPFVNPFKKTEGGLPEQMPQQPKISEKSLARIKEIETEMNDILTEFEGFSNIPMNSRYWILRNELAGLRK